MSFPVATTGLPLFLPTLFPEGLFIYVAGCADAGTSGRGQGVPFMLQSSAQDGPGVKTLACSFADWVYFSGGGIRWQGAQLGDWCSLQIVAPPSVVTANPQGQGAVDVAGPYVVPNLKGSGQYDVATAIPIHAVDNGNNPLGQWEWSTPDTGLGDVLPGPEQANGRPLGPYVLQTREVLLAQFIARFPLSGDGTWNMSMPFIKPGHILPHWEVRVLLNNATGHDGLSFAWNIVMGRAQTV